jgi:hypothetical protein
VFASFCQSEVKTVFFHGKNRPDKNTFCLQKIYCLPAKILITGKLESKVFAANMFLVGK